MSTQAPTRVTATSTTWPSSTTAAWQQSSITGITSIIRPRAARAGLAAARSPGRCSPLLSTAAAAYSISSSPPANHPRTADTTRRPHPLRRWTRQEDRWRTLVISARRWAALTLAVSPAYAWFCCASMSPNLPSAESRSVHPDAGRFEAVRRLSALRQCGRAQRPAPRARPHPHGHAHMQRCGGALHHGGLRLALSDLPPCQRHGPLHLGFW